MNKIIKSGKSNSNKEFILLDRKSLNEEYQVIRKLKSGLYKTLYKSSNFINCSVYFNHCFKD